MKIKILLFLFLSNYTFVFSQKSHCRTLNSNVVIGDTLGLNDKSPYKQNTRANLIFYRKKINHLGCNENEYEIIVNENFDSTLESTPFELTSPESTPPFNTYDPNPGGYLALIYRDSNVIIKDGLAHLKVTDDHIQHSYFEMDTVFQQNGDTLLNPIEKKVIGYSAGRLITKEDKFDEAWEIEDCGCYKYGKFSSRMKFPKSDDATFAFWFYGCGNEIDVFEFFNGTDNDLKSSIHQWNVKTDENDTHAQYGLNYNLGDLSRAYHEWTLEWTPYKITWSVDGMEFRTFYKYYKRKTETNGNKKKVCFIGLDCPDIPLEETEVWELSGWHTFSSRPVGLILGPGLLGPADSELIVDWVKIEQKPNLQLTMTNHNPCLGEEVIITAANTDQIVNWQVSSNLEIISIDDNVLTVLGNEDATLGWVEAKVIGNNIPLPLNNYTTIGYTFNDELDEREELHQYRNASYNCHETDFKVRKSILVGTPPHPDFDNNMETCANQFEIWDNNYEALSPFSEYQWNSSSENTFTYKTNQNTLAVFPTSYSFGKALPYELEISNNCGTISITDTLAIQNCDEENLIKLPLLLFPNPSSDVIQFKLLQTTENHFLPSESPYFIIEASGKLIHQGQLGNELHAIDISSWAQGNYKIVYEIEGKLYSKPFSKVQ